MAKTILVYSGKGGVGKTTTVAGFAGILSDAKKRTLMIDLDPNNTLSAYRMKNLDGLTRTIREALNGENRPEDSMYQVNPYLWIMPALKSLAKIEKDQADNPDQFLVLKDTLSQISNFFDYIILDAPGATNLLTKAAIVAADIVVIPTRLEQFDVSAIEDVFEEINRCARQRQGIPLEKIAIMPTFYEEKNAVHEGFRTSLIAKYGEYVMKTIIHKARAISWANMSADTALDKTSRAFQEYQLGITEVLPEAGL